MYALVFLCQLFLFHASSVTGTLSENHEDVASLTTYLHQLEKRLSTLESESKKSNQDQAAVLASTELASTETELKSVKTQLTSTSDELSVVKAKMNSTRQYNYTTYMHQLEQKFSTLESQSKVNDQKYAAVLSSILSRLTSITDELLVVKANLTSSTDELSVVKANLTSTSDKLKVVEAKLTSTSDELSVVKAKLTSTTDELSLAEAKLNSTCLNNNTTHIHQLEQKLSTLESQSNVNDKKYTTVLSSVLSNLISTTDELTMLKTQMNLTSVQLITNTYELRCVKSMLDSNTSSLEWGVGFEASLHAHLHLDKNHTNFDTLKLDTAGFNAGGGYNKTSGVFTAPISGQYLFWFNIFFKSRDPLSVEANVTLMVNNHAVTSAVTEIPRQHMGYSVSGDVNDIYLVFVTKGETAYLQTNLNGLIVKDDSSFGGVLISSRFTN